MQRPKAPTVKERQHQMEYTQARQDQGQQKRSYENSPWINVHDWQVTKRTNGKTNDDFWNVKLAKGTFIDVEGGRVDVSGYHFHTNYEPSVSFGDPGTPRCKRGIHFPEGWDIALQRFENTAPAGEPPVFVEAGRIENVTPQQIADGLRDRRERWRASSRETAAPEQARSNSREGGAPSGNGELGKPPANAGQTLTPYIHREGTEPDLDCIYENDMSATLVSMGFSSSFNPLGPDYGDQATVIFRDKGSEAQVHVSTILFEKDGRPFLDFDAPGRTALIATDLSGRDVLFIQRDGTLGEKLEAMEKALGITPQGEKRGSSDPPFSFDAAVRAFQEWEPGGKGRGDEELDPISEMNRKHLSRLGRPRAEIAPVDHETPKRRDRSLER